MIREDLVAERIAIDSYREMIRYLGDGDPTTRRMLEGILAVEEEHADDMLSLIENVSRQQRRRRLTRLSRTRVALAPRVRGRGATRARRLSPASRPARPSAARRRRSCTAPGGGARRRRTRRLSSSTATENAIAK